MQSRTRWNVPRYALSSRGSCPARISDFYCARNAVLPRTGIREIRTLDPPPGNLQDGFCPGVASVRLHSPKHAYGPAQIPLPPDCDTTLRVESPGGIAPPGAHRSGRERLRSSGSYRPAVARQHRPVGEESRITQGDLANPVLGLPPMPSQAFVFRHRPARKAPVQIAQRRIKC